MEFPWVAVFLGLLGFSLLLLIVLPKRRRRGD